MIRHVKVLPWAVAIGLVLFTLLGANRLLQTEDGSKGADGNVKAGKANHAPTSGGVTVLGTVSSDPPETPVGPPAIAGMLTVDRMFVTEGQTVNAGDPLVQFDDVLVREKVKQAQAELDAAREDLVKAETQKKVQPIQIEALELLVKTGEDSLKDGNDQLATGRDVFERTLGFFDPLDRKPRTEADNVRQRRENLELRRAETMLRELSAKVEGDRKKLKMLRMVDPDSNVRAASQKIIGLTAKVAEAQNAINACVLRAKTAGVIEQIHAAPGMTFGPSTRTPVLWLLPTGKRVVRAEVEAEFAYKIAEKEGRKVTIYDGSNFTLVYEGTLRRISTGYLPKRSQVDSLTVNPTKVLECTIEVTDPTPPGKPPLRIGQPVRVSFH